MELWLDSIASVAELEPERLLLTHFGAAEDPAEHLDAMATELRRLSEAARTSERTEFLARLEERIGVQGGDAAARIRSAMPPEQVWLGLERWRDRVARAS